MNIDTDLGLASTGAVRQFLHDNPANFDPRKFYRAAEDAMMQICKARFEVFGCAGHASRIKPLGLNAMCERYERGLLNQSIN